MVTLSEIAGGGFLCRVGLPDGIGSVFYTFTDIEQYRADEINCVLKAEWFIADNPPKNLESRVNLLSPSTRQAFIKDISDLSGISLKATFFDALEAVKEAIRNKDDSHWVEEVSPESAEMLFDPFLVQGAPNLLFGKGEGAKTFTCLRLALSLATGLPFVGFKPKRRVKTLFVDYEDTAATCSDRIMRLCSGQALKDAPLEDTQGWIRYFNPRGTPLADAVYQIKKIILENKIELVIVDSAVAACGGEPEKADVTRRYFNALASLGVTTLTIAHETKSENHQYPFGSVFWFNFPRSIWNVRAVHEQDETNRPDASVLETGLFHRKANNGPRMPSVPLRVVFGQKMTDIVLGDSSLWEDERTVKSRILSLLKDKMLTAGEIADELSDVGGKTLESGLRRLRKSGEIELLGTKGTPYRLAKKSPLQPS